VGTIVLWADNRWSRVDVTNEGNLVSARHKQGRIRLSLAALMGLAAVLGIVLGLLAWPARAAICGSARWKATRRVAGGQGRVAERGGTGWNLSTGAQAAGIPLYSAAK
jgi:hypothetical protein